MYDPSGPLPESSPSPGTGYENVVSMAGTLLVWHGSLRRWKKCHVDARRIGVALCLPFLPHTIKYEHVHGAHRDHCISC